VWSKEWFYDITPHPGQGSLFAATRSGGKECSSSWDWSNGNPGGKLSLTPWYVGEYDCMLTASSSILACCVVRDWIEREIV